MINGYYDFYVNDVKVASTDNMILETGVSRLPSSSQRLRCGLGTGITPLLSTDTSLENEIIFSTTISDYFFWYDENPFSVTHSIVYNFTVPVNGIEFTEVGVGETDALLSRAIIKDNNGFPTTIKINGDESLRVIHSITHTPIQNDVIFTKQIDDVTYTFTLRCAGHGDQNAWRSVAGSGNVFNATFHENFVLSDPSLSGIVGTGESTVSSYTESATRIDKGLKYRVILGSNEGVFPNGISGIVFQTGGDSSDPAVDGFTGKYQVQIQPPIFKLDFDLIFVFEIKLLP